MKLKHDMERKRTTVTAISEVDRVRRIAETTASGKQSVAGKTFEWRPQTKQLCLSGHVDATREPLIRAEDMDVL
jgi:hypothetical protein